MNKKYYRHLLFILLPVLILSLTFFTLSGCSKINTKDLSFKIQDQVGKTDGESEEIMLPDPKLKGSISLEEALKIRRSIRDFSEKDLTLEDISQILWAAQGITEESLGFRTAPSAGALYPLELFVVKSDGLFHYVAEEHKLEKLSSQDLRQKLMKASLFQESISTAPIDIVITAIYERTTAKYGERGIRYVHIEAGHACQNILLQAAALQLGAVPIGAFSDDEVQKVLNLPAAYKPLYVIPVGHPR
jgi:SagB-type dehydrogenase family enzyme